MMRSTRQKESARDEIGEEIWNQLDSDEQKMLIFISTRKEVKAEELANLIQKTKRTVNNKINKLIELDVIKLNGNKYDNTHTYSLR